MNLSEQLKALEPTLQNYEIKGASGCFTVSRDEFYRLRDIAVLLAEAVSHPWLLEEMNCECGYYGDDSEESGMSQCAKCAIQEAIQKAQEILNKEK